MGVSRRHFLGTTTGAIASLAAVARNSECRDWHEPSIELSTDPKPDHLRCVLLDLEQCCGLRESVAGYEAALVEARIPFVRCTSDVLLEASVVIVPGCAWLEPSLAMKLRLLLEGGALLLLESGAAFSDRASAGVHQKVLRFHFGLQVEAPIELWPEAVEESARGPEGLSSQKLSSRTRVPYVDYAWPVRAKVRDFSRVVPLSTSTSKVDDLPANEAIGWVDGRPIAARRPVGKGQLVFLGSPLGPALRSGDREAECWLTALLRSM